MTDRVPPQETRVTFVIHRPFRTSLGIALGLMTGLFIPGLLLGFIINAITALGETTIPITGGDVTEETRLPQAAP